MIDWTRQARASAVLLATAVAGTAAGARETVGVYGGWGSFRDDAPARCYAVAGPADLPRSVSSPTFVSIASWPTRRVVNQVHVRLGREARDGSAILLSIDGQVFQLVGRRFDAWAPSHAVDRAVVAAMRTGIDLRVSARDRNGNAFTDRYALSGAASAIDAAALACLPR